MQLLCCEHARTPGGDQPACHRGHATADHAKYLVSYYFLADEPLIRSAPSSRHPGAGVLALRSGGGLPQGGGKSRAWWLAAVPVALAVGA